jgi:hypothetical protein
MAIIAACNKNKVVKINKATILKVFLLLENVEEKKLLNDVRKFESFCLIATILTPIY